jgi:putative tryptophan/tyrosine transport system substrate-binding protein
MGNPLPAGGFDSNALSWGMAHRNTQIDTRWATPDNAELMRNLAKELVAVEPDLLLSSTTPTTSALLQQTRTIPIRDRCRSGWQRLRGEFRASWRQRHRLYLYGADDGGQVAGTAQRDCTAHCPSRDAVQPGVGDLCRNLPGPLESRRCVAVEAIAAPVHDTSELEAVVAAHAREPNGGLIVMPDGFLNAHRAEVISMAARYRLPAVYQYRYYPELGGLMSYGNDPLDNCRRAASYADRILKGEKPSTLPVQAPVKFELVINLKTAKALGLDVPLFLQQRADDVIE